MKIEGNIGNMSLIQGQEMLKVNKDQEVEKSFGKLLEKAQTQQDDEQLKEACQEMESYFIQELYKIMRTSTQLGEGIITKGQHEEIFEDMLIEAQSKEATKAGGIGLADMLYRQLSKEQVALQYKAAQETADIKG